MASKSNTKAAMLLNLVLLLSLLLVIDISESKLLGVGFAKPKATPVCIAAIGAAEGDSCFTICQKFKVSAPFFTSINPNLVCDKIFVGQWICVRGDGKLN